MGYLGKSKQADCKQWVHQGDLMMTCHSYHPATVYYQRALAEWRTKDGEELRNYIKGKLKKLEMVIKN